MALKYNGVDAGDGGVRWYNPETGNIIHKELSDYELDHNVGEIEFSRMIIKSRKRVMTLHPDHKESPETKGAFWVNGICSDKDLRITFATGMKDRIVISKNLIDFLFCSTDQSFTSCFRLDNDTYDKLEMFNGVEGFFISYITQENVDYEYRDTVYNHPKMMGRAWLFRSNDGQHYTVGRPYGKSGYELRDALRRWLPNGTEIGWKLNDQQKNIQRHEYDNFFCGKTIHDKYDKTFNSKKLYTDEDTILIKVK